MTFMMNKLAMINSCEIIFEYTNNFFDNSHCELQVHTLLVCAFYSVKYGRLYERKVLNPAVTALTDLLQTQSHWLQ
jgi:hypothetical protein